MVSLVSSQQQYRRVQAAQRWDLSRRNKNEEAAVLSSAGMREPGQASNNRVLLLLLGTQTQPAQASV